MKWLWIIGIIALAWWAYQQRQAPEPAAASPEHAAITQQAKQAEAKAQQAAAIASKDTVAEYEQQNQ